MFFRTKPEKELAATVAIAPEVKTPKASEIKRFVPKSNLSEETRAVLSNARTLLGHRAGKDDPRLEDALNELGIEALDGAQVNTYKDATRGAYNKKLYSHSPGWNVYKLEDYREAIPIHVLEKAIQIKSKLSDVQFSVHALQESSITRDPFLWVSHDGFGYFIDVWDEPKFE